MEEPEPSVELIFNTKKKAETHNASKPAVEVRNFVNNMNDYKVPRRGTEEAIAKSQQVPLTRLTAPRVALWVPPEFLEHSFPHSSVFLKAAIKLKDEVVQATWTRNAQMRVDDPTMYTGVLGSAMLCFKAFLTTNLHTDLVLCSEIVDSCCAAAPTHPDATDTKSQGWVGCMCCGDGGPTEFISVRMDSNVTFLRGQAGIYAMGAVAAHFRGDSIRRDFFLQHFNRIAERRVLSMGPAGEGGGLPCELLNGRVGFLYATLFINRYLGQETVPWCMTGPIVDAVLAAGRSHSTQECPLMYPWRSRRFWGASHGLAGIVQVLLHFPLKEQDTADIQGTLYYMMRNRYFRGNYRISVEDDHGDRLVHWCHGAPGITITLCKAIKMYPRSLEWKLAAEAATNLVWERGLLRRVGLCHGISGNAYIFLALHRVLEGDKKQLFRARQFAGWVYKHGKRLLAEGEMHGGDHRHSLFEGLGGLACLWFDVACPNFSFFPGYEIN